MDDLILANARVIDGLGGVMERATVRVAGNRIAEVEAGADVEPKPGGEVIDLSGRMLMPALIDAHIHFSSYPTLPEPLRGEEPRAPALRYFELANHARALVEMGVLTVRDVGSGDDHALHLRQAIQLGLCQGPRVLACGRIVSATSPGCRIFTTMYRPADGCDEARKAVREQLMMGADFVKVMTTGARSVVLEDPEPAQLARKEVRTIVEEAHRMGSRVAAHVEGLEGGRITVEEGGGHDRTRTLPPPRAGVARPYSIERPVPGSDPLDLPQPLARHRREVSLRARRSSYAPARRGLREAIS